MRSIDIYPTRIEIYPYIMSDDDVIARQCSTDFDKSRFKRYPYGYMYLEDEQKMVTMRGLDINWLAQYVNGYPNFCYPPQSAKLKYQYKMKFPPRNKEQLQAIKFLLGYGEFRKYAKYAQLSLNTEPSFGKTFCSIAAALERGVRTLIIVHNTTIKEQWHLSLLEKTTVPENRIMDISGTDNMRKMLEESVDADFIIILHQSINAYLDSEGYERTKEWFNHLECGTKIIDEVHLFFQNTAQIDFCSTIEKNYYLTGTMTRSNPLEIRLFRRYFQVTPSFGATLAKTRNVVYEFVNYDTCPSEMEQAYILTSKGPNSSRFMHYSLEMDPDKTIIDVMFRTLKRAKEHPGKTAIIVPKIDVSEYLKTLIEKRYPEDDVRTIHSKHKHEENEESKKEADIIISTIGGFGTGTDIMNLRNMIIMDLYSSEVTANQLPKRLRPLPNDEESYCYELVNCGFEPIVNMVKKKTRFLKKCCKAVKTSTYYEYEEG